MSGTADRRAARRGARRPSAGSRSPPRLLTCRLAVDLPHGVWMRRLSEAHPHTRIEIVDRLPLDKNRTIFDVRVPRERGVKWDRELARLPGVTSMESLGSAEGEEGFRVEFTGATFLPLLGKHRVLRRFPFPIQGGVATWVLVGPEPRIRKLLRSLDEGHVRYRVESVHHRAIPRGIPGAPLTGRQREILRRAIVEGYFEVPRRVSLTGLAAKLGVATSTLSVALAVIERKIVGTVAT